MTTTPLPDVPVRSATGLTQRWADLLLDPPTFGRRSLWLAWLDTDGAMLPVVIPIDDLPVRPDLSVVRGLMDLHTIVTERNGYAEGHLAIALSRPGSAEVSEDDEDWADAIESELGDHAHDCTWSLHVAASGRVTELVSGSPASWR